MEHGKKQAINQNWASLTPFLRNWLRAEYRHLLLADVHPIIARGSINRMANMFVLAKAGI